MTVLKTTAIPFQEQTDKDRMCQLTPERRALLVAEQGIRFGLRFVAHSSLLVSPAAEQPSLEGCATPQQGPRKADGGVRRGSSPSGHGWSLVVVAGDQH